MKTLQKRTFQFRWLHDPKSCLLILWRLSHMAQCDHLPFVIVSKVLVKNQSSTHEFA